MSLTDRQSIVLANCLNLVKIIEEDGSLFAISLCCEVNATRDPKDEDWFMCGACSTPLVADTTVSMTKEFELSMTEEFEFGGYSGHSAEVNNLLDWLSFWSGYKTDDIQVEVSF